VQVIEFFNTNKEWIIPGIGVVLGLLTALIKIIISIRRRFKDKRDKGEKRIERFVDEFRERYKSHIPPAEPEA